MVLFNEWSSGGRVRRLVNLSPGQSGSVSWNVGQYTKKLYHIGVHARGNRINVFLSLPIPLQN